MISVQKVTVPIRPESEHLRGSGSLAQGKSLSGNDFLLVPHSACEALFVGLIGSVALAGKGRAESVVGVDLRLPGCRTAVPLA